MRPTPVTVSTSNLGGSGLQRAEGCFPEPSTFAHISYLFLLFTLQIPLGSNPMEGGSEYRGDMRTPSSGQAGQCQTLSSPLPNPPSGRHLTTYFLCPRVSPHCVTSIVPPSQHTAPLFSHRFLKAPDFCTACLRLNPRGLTSSRCWGRTGTCRCVQTVVAPGQTPGPTASGHQVGNSARHSSAPAGRRRVRGGWVKGPGATTDSIFPPHLDCLCSTQKLVEPL